MAAELEAGVAFIDVKGRLASGFGQDIADKVEDETSGPMEKTSGKLGGILKAGLAAAGVAAGAALVKGFGDALDRESINNKLTAQFNLSEQAAAVAGEATANLYAGAWGDSMGDVGAAIGAVGKELVDLGTVAQSELEKITASALDVASAFDHDVSEVTRAAGQLLRNGLAPNAEAAMDIVAAGFENGFDRADDFLDTVNEYSASFARLGFTGPEVLGKLNAGLDAGVFNTDKLGDAFNEFSIRAIEGSKGSQNAIHALGLDVEDTEAIIARGGPAAAAMTNEIIDSLARLEDPIERDMAGVALFGSMWEDLGEEAILALGSTAGSLDDVAGTATRVGDKINSGLGVKLESLRRQVLVKLADFAEKVLIPAVERIATVAAPAAETIATAIGTIGTVVADTVAVVQRNWDTLGPIFTTVGVIISTVLIPHFVALGVSATVNAAKTVAAWVTTQAAAIAAAATHSAQVALQIGKWVLMGAQATVHAAVVVAGWVATGVAAVAQTAVAVAQFAIQIARWVAMGVAATANAAVVAAAWLISIGPIAAVVAAVVGAVVLIVKNWDTIKDAAKAVWEWIRDRFNDIVEFIKGIPGKMADVGKGAFNWLYDSFKEIWNKIARFIRAIDFTIDVPDFLPGIPDEVTIGFPDLPLLAKGGRIGRSGLALVGDAGPEIVNLPTGATVVPLDVAAALTGAGPGGAPLVGELNINGAEMTATDVADELYWLRLTRGA